MRLNGRAAEAVAARLTRRPPCDLFHSALEVHLAGARHVIEMTPAWGAGGRPRGVVAEGPVGARWAGRSRLFRYEVRRWRDGAIPDAAEAVDSPVRLGDDAATARRVLELVPGVPTPVWGRDGLRTGGMWNSNSLTAWLIASAGLDVEAVRPPRGGRAPGWHAGVVMARRAPPA